MCCHNPVLLVQNFDYVVVSGASRQDNVPKPKEGEMLSVEGEGTVGGDSGRGQGTRTGGGDKGAGTGRMCTDCRCSSAALFPQGSRRQSVLRRTPCTVWSMV